MEGNPLAWGEGVRRKGGVGEILRLKVRYRGLEIR